jgi:hypothetical protein
VGRARRPTGKEGELSDDAQDFPSVDAEQARAMLAVVYQGIRAALTLNSEMATALQRRDNEEADHLNDSMFVTLNDVRQRLEEVIGRSQ